MLTLDCGVPAGYCTAIPRCPTGSRLGEMASRSAGSLLLAFVVLLLALSPAGAVDVKLQATQVLLERNNPPQWPVNPELTALIPEEPTNLR